MKLERIAYLFFVAFLVLFAASQAKSDIVVFKSGNYRECTITGADEKYVITKTDFGEQKFPRTDIVDFYSKEAGKPGSEYFRAGELYAKYNLRAKASELFEKAVQANPAYREQADKILAGTGVAGTGTQPITASMKIPVTVEMLMCPVCNGEGKRQQKTKTMSGSEIERVVPCYFCNAKGLKYFELPNGTRKCPTCGGWGYKPSTTTAAESTSSGSGSSTGTTIKMGKGGGIEVKQACFQCSGKGYIGQAKAIETVKENPALFIAATTGNVGYCSVTGTTTAPPTGTTGTGSMGGTGSMNPATGTSMPVNPSGTNTTTQPPTPTGSDTSAATEPSSEEKKSETGEAEKKEAEPEEEPGFFSKYKTFLLIGGGVALLAVVLLLSKSSKK